MEAQSILINFESAPFSATVGPNNFLAAGAMQSNGISGQYSISGGVVLGNPTFLPSFTTNNRATPPNLYGTADFADPSLQSSITLQLDPSLGTLSVSGVLFNGQPMAESYSVSAYAGNSLVTVDSFTVPADTGTNGFNQFFVSADAGTITSLVFTTPNANVNGWDFFVDSLDLSVQSVPEPQPFLLVGVGLAFFGRRKWRGRALLIGGLLALRLASEQRTMAAPTWVEQGPGPISAGQSEKIGYAGVTNPVTGAINAIVVNPSDINTIYLATVNGGVWVTHDPYDIAPVWTPLTDQQLPALSIASLGISPANNNILFAGTGSTSSFGYPGSPMGTSGLGVARSTDGGSTWTLFATNTFKGVAVLSVVPTMLSGGNVVLAATCPALFNFPAPDNGGVYRSTDNGVTFNRISGGSGLPDSGVTSLVADPGNANRFYAGVPANGVYRSDDGGVTWKSLDVLPVAARILLSVNQNSSVVYAMVIAPDGTLNAVYRSANLGTNWTSMGAPTPAIFPGAQGKSNGAILADPNNTNVVFIAGDRQETNGSPAWPNVNGCSDYSANIFRGDASQPPATRWQTVVGNGAKGSSPHADSRALVFYNVGIAGAILYAGDGGLSRLVDPNNSIPNRFWIDDNGNIRPTEIHSVAYDPLNNTIISGDQDTGTPMQSAGGNFSWKEYISGDGAVVAVDADQTAHPGTSIRYCGFNNFSAFNRTSWNNANTQVGGFTYVGLMVTNAAPVATTNLLAWDGTVMFYNPFVLNAITPSRMLIGTQRIYESMDRGDTLNMLVDTGNPIGDGISQVPMSYGSRSNGVAMADAFYVGAGASVYHRAVIGRPVNPLPSYPGSVVRGVVMDVQNFRNVYVVDQNSQIWASFDEGVTWNNLTLNLTNLCSDVKCIELFSPTNTPMNTVLLAGGLGGIYQMRRPSGGGTIWTNLSSGLPHALVTDIHYNYANNILVAGSLGRGAWTLSQYFRGGGPPTNAFPPIVAFAETVASATPAPRPGTAAPMAPYITQLMSPPALTLGLAGSCITLAWPVTSASYGLEVSSNLTQSNGWSPVTATAVVGNGTNTVTLPVTSHSQFYRLNKQ